jgi:Transcription initiation factor IID, 31kD subunit
LELVADAQDCAYAAHRHEITRADLAMALELRPDQANTHTIGELQKMTMVAHNINRIPLPPIPQNCFSGILLPPKPHQLTARTFDIITGAQTAQRMKQTLPVPKKKAGAGAGSATTSAVSTTNNPSYGVSRGRMIPIHLNATTNPPTSTAPAPTDGAPTPTTQGAVATPSLPTTTNTTTTTSTVIPNAMVPPS